MSSRKCHRWRSIVSWREGLPLTPRFMGKGMNNSCPIGLVVALPGKYDPDVDFEGVLEGKTAQKSNTSQVLLTLQGHDLLVAPRHRVPESRDFSGARQHHPDEHPEWDRMASQPPASNQERADNADLARGRRYPGEHFPALVDRAPVSDGTLGGRDCVVGKGFSARESNPALSRTLVAVSSSRISRLRGDYTNRYTSEEAMHASGRMRSRRHRRREAWSTALTHIMER